MKYYKYSMNINALNWISVILFIPLFFIIYLLNLWKFIDIYFLVLYFLWMFLHELLHGIGFSLNKDINHKNIVYGAALEKGILYCMCKEKISKNSIMISLVFPFFIIGIFTFFIGLIINNEILMLLSLFNIVGCIGDLVMFFNFLNLPDFSYVDLDDCTGFVLISDNNLNKKLFGLNLIEMGDINDLSLAGNYDKITISKLSIVIFIIIVIFVIVKLISSFII